MGAAIFSVPALQIIGNCFNAGTITAGTEVDTKFQTRPEKASRILFAFVDARSLPEVRANFRGKPPGRKRLMHSKQPNRRRPRLDEPATPNSALLAAEEKYRDIFENAVEGIYQSTPEGRYLSVNPALARIFGYESPEQMQRAGRDAGTGLYIDPTCRAGFTRLLAGRSEVLCFEYETQRRDGQSIWVSATARAVRDARGAIRYFEGSIQDITEGKLAEVALRESEKRFHNLARISPVGIFRTDAAGHCNYVNQRWCQLTGIAEEEAWGTGWGRALHPDDRERVLAEWNRSLQKPPPFQAEYRFVRPDGTVVWVFGQAVAETDQAGKVMHFVGTITDLSDRKKMEARILEISDREQARIGQDLHDGLCQQLVGLSLRGKIHTQKLAATSPAAGAEAKAITDGLQEAIRQARGLARGLYPVQLDADGFMSALGELAVSLERMFQVPCRFQCAQPVLLHDIAAATHLYRIAQEAANNALKHSRARQIVIELSARQNQIILTVKDDGSGFPKVLKAGSGMGMHIMNYRAGLIGATLNIRGGADGGTVVTCAFAPPAPQPKQRKHHGKKKQIAFKK